MEKIILIGRSKFEQITPSWSLTDFKSNLRRPLFYLYMTVPIMLLIFGVLILWMTFEDASKRDMAGRLISFAFAGGFLSAFYKGAAFKLREKNWPAIIFGGLCLVPLFGSGALMLGGEKIDDPYFLVAAAVVGPTFLLWGLFGFRAVGHVAVGAIEGQ